MKSINYSVFVLLLLAACTPKGGEKIVVEEKPPVKEVDLNDPCRTWNGLKNQDEIIEYHVLYRDFLKEEKYAEALPFWKKVYAAAPMADGRRTTHFEDGIKLKHYLIKNSEDEAERGRLKKEIMDDLLPAMRACAKEPGYAAGLQAFDLYYNYPDLASDKEIYDLFKMAIDESGEKTKAFVLNPFARVLADLHLKGEIPLDEAQTYASKIEAARVYGVANCKDDCDDWAVVDGYVPSQMDRLESVKGFFDCAYYMDKYYPVFKKDPANCDVVEESYVRMKWGGCDVNDPKIKEVAAAKAALCKEPVSGNPDLVEGRDCLENGRYKCAVNAYERYANSIDDKEKKAKYLLRVAKIYYAHLKNYPMARKYALSAAKHKSNWGAPYMLIGSLYASSGPLCGPGRGWDSQIVTWPAIDKWAYARKIDGSVASEANKLISRYSQYMPSREDIFQRGINEGQSFKVGCWINESTVVRVAK